MGILKQSTKIGLIAVLIVIVTILHYSSAYGTLGAHITHRELYFIPILLSSFWFGLKYGLATSLAISLIYAPRVFVDSETQHNLWPVLFQIMMFNIVALLVGFLVERGKRQQERIFAVEKSVALGRAATAVGHEMKDLLEALKSIAGQTARPESAKLNRDLEKELARLEQLVDIFFAFKATSPPQLLSIDLNEIIRQSVNYHRPVAQKKGVSFKNDLDAEGCPSRLDTETISRVFDRIIQNALDVSSGGKTIHIHSTRRGDHCQVIITDEGPGIKPEHLSSIFKPFFTTKDQGDGLALSASQKALRDMGGDIQVASEYGKGAAFTITVPREYSGKPLVAGPIAPVKQAENIERLHGEKDAPSI
jgi:signal transduction histidine kinase